jgi:hypothetical protein
MGLMELRSYAYAFIYIAELPEFPINKVFMEAVHARSDENVVKVRCKLTLDFIILHGCV